MPKQYQNVRCFALHSRYHHQNKRPDQSDKNVVVREEFAKQPWDTRLRLKEEHGMVTKTNKCTQDYETIL